MKMMGRRVFRGECTDDLHRTRGQVRMEERREMAKEWKEIRNTVPRNEKRVAELRDELQSSVTCPDCGRTSYHPMDVQERYCGACHCFLDD